MSWDTSCMSRNTSFMSQDTSCMSRDSFYVTHVAACKHENEVEFGYGGHQKRDAFSTAVLTTKLPFQVLSTGLEKIGRYFYFS